MWRKYVFSLSSEHFGLLVPLTGVTSFSPNYGGKSGASAVLALQTDRPTDTVHMWNYRVRSVGGCVQNEYYSGFVFDPN